jgi:type IV pilus assembly protein PilV
MTDARFQHPHARQHGFTLVESLVAMVVISVGMLGIAAMYVEGLRASRTSVYRTVAVELAADMADRIRANPTAGAAYTGVGAANGCVNGDVDCTPAQIATSDLFWWRSDLVARLPGGAAVIGFAAGGGLNTYTITINWNEPGVAEALQYSVAVQI